jgi:hypothetical protein
VGARRNVSRNADAFCQSRKVSKIAGTSIRADLVGHLAQSPTFHEGGVDLPIPNSIVAFADKGGQFGQFFG